MQKLDKGIFGLSNAHLNTPWPKVNKAREELKRRLDSGVLDLNDLQAVLQDPQTAPDEELPDTGIDPALGETTVIAVYSYRWLWYALYNGCSEEI